MNRAREETRTRLLLGLSSIHLILRTLVLRLVQSKEHTGQKKHTQAAAKVGGDATGDLTFGWRVESSQALLRSSMAAR
jgi:hypothetical protein